MSGPAAMREAEFRRILGIEFFCGSARAAVERMRNGGLLVVPAAPALKELGRDRGYREALLNADLAITDSAYMVLVWNLLRRDSVRRLSGLEYLRELLGEPEVRTPGCTFWIMAGERSAQLNLTWLASQGIAVPEHCVYLAPLYGEEIEDPKLMEELNRLQPRHVVVTLGGGTQERLGFVPQAQSGLPARHPLHRSGHRLPQRRPDPYPCLRRSTLSGMAVPLHLRAQALCAAVLGARASCLRCSCGIRASCHHFKFNVHGATVDVERGYSGKRSLRVRRTWLSTVCLALGLWRCWASAQNVSEQYLLAAANDDRTAHHLSPLRTDEGLLRSARLHAVEMANHRDISHQFAGEAELAERAGEAGVRFSLITENVAQASNSALIHELLMRSAGHRANLLDPQVDSVGIAVVQRDGQIYAVEDFARTVQYLTLEEQEGTVRTLLADAGLAFAANPRDARATCAKSSGYVGERRPWFVMRYTSADIQELPKELLERLNDRRYHLAAIGACDTGSETPFTGYNLAVLLYP